MTTLFHPELAHSMRDLYAAYDLDIIPLRTGSKMPLRKKWATGDPATMWEDAPPTCNLGIRAGGRRTLAVVDCDTKNDPATADHVRGYLDGLGLSLGSYPLVQTASGDGRHAYFSLPDAPLGQSRFALVPAIGSGDLRTGPGAYTVAPPSVIGSDRVYRLIAGSFRVIPSLQWRDVQRLLRLGFHSDNPTPAIDWSTYPRVDDLTIRIPELARKLLTEPTGNQRQSRSEAEQTIITVLLREYPGISDEQIRHILSAHPYPGKYQEIMRARPADGEKYLARSIRRARARQAEYLASTQEIRALLQAAEAADGVWSGRFGCWLQALHIAHLTIAASYGSREYRASLRQLSEITGCTRMTLSHGNAQLSAMGLIQLVALHDGAKAPTYRVM